MGEVVPVKKKRVNKQLMINVVPTKNVDFELLRL